MTVNVALGHASNAFLIAALVIYSLSVVAFAGNRLVLAVPASDAKVSSLEDRQHVVLEKLKDLGSKATEARSHRIQQETAWKQVTALSNDVNALLVIPAGVHSSSLMCPLPISGCRMMRAVARATSSFAATM